MKSGELAFDMFSIIVALTLVLSSAGRVAKLFKSGCKDGVSSVGSRLLIRRHLHGRMEWSYLRKHILQGGCTVQVRKHAMLYQQIQLDDQITDSNSGSSLGLWFAGP